MPITDQAVWQLRRTYNNRLRAIDAYVEFIGGYDATKHRSQIPSRLQALEQTKQEYETIRDKLLVNLDECDEAALSSEERLFYEHYHNVKGFLSEQTVDENCRPFANSTMSSTMTSSAKIKLPRIELPSFDGDITQWITFKDRFMSMVHEMVDLTDVMKLQYLLAALKGDALAQFDHVQLSAGNYETTWKALLTRYDDSKILRREYFKALYRLEPMKEATAEELTRVANECTRLVKGMERLSEPVEDWNTPLTCLVRWKLHSKLLIEWEQFSADEKADTYGKIMEFCERQIKMLTNTALDHGSSIITKPVAKGSNYNRVVTKSTAPRGWSQRASDKPERKTPGTWTICSAQVTQPEHLCVHCKSNHLLSSCAAFERFSIAERVRIAQEGAVCFRCLKGGHRSRWCKSRNSCSKCGGRHHTLICSRNEPTDPQAKMPSQQPSSSESGMITATSYGIGRKMGMIWLSTAIVFIRGNDGQEFPARALLDQGSQINFVSERLVQQLQLQKRRLEKSLHGIGSIHLTADSVVTTRIRSRIKPFTAHLDFMVLPKVINNFPLRYVDVSEWKIPEELVLADPAFSEPDSIDLLIGAEIFAELLEEGHFKLAPRLPMLLNTKLGWIVCGREEIHTNNTNSEVVACGLFEEGVKRAMDRLVSLEGVPEDRVKTAEEEALEKWYIKSTCRASNGRYIVELPKIQPVAKLGSSGPVARRRLLAVERRMKTDPVLRKEYLHFMSEYENMGHMERICSYSKDIGENEHFYYIPHHAVWKLSSTTTKCRVVFDASCKSSSGQSLNDILLTGPQLQDEILPILLRFRMRTVAMIADKEKMYRQIVVQKEDRRFQRILWRPNEEDPIGVYELKTVTYGTACAPYLAIRTLRKVFEDHVKEFPKAQQWYDDFYVDDLLSGAENVEEARLIADQLITMLGKGGFTIRKWASNEPSVLSNIPEEHRAHTDEINVDKEEVSTLGLIWVPMTDQFKIQIPSIDASKPITKRSVMSNVARIYDPLGFLDPIKMTAKLTLQKIWGLNDKQENQWPWDEPLPEQMQSEWKSFIQQLNRLDQIRIPRRPCTDGDWQYHIFCDASEKGYGASVYVRNETAARGVEVTLLFSKSKVASLGKRLTIARLELCGAVLASRLYQTIQRANLKKATCYLWTDSMTVWHWIKAPHHNWKTFVANRVAKIQELTKDCYWRHVPGVMNPADLVSRGCEPDEFLEKVLWWSGPEWLKSGAEDWPDIPSKGETTIEERRLTVAVASAGTEENFSNYLFSRSSSYVGLQRIVGYCLRFIDVRLKRRKEQTGSFLTTEELNRAERAMCRLTQTEWYPEDIRLLKNNQLLSKRSELVTLSPYLDETGLIRVGGRLKRSALHENAKHPIVIPSGSRLATLLIECYHKKLLHAGPQLIATQLRQRFWITRARSSIRKITRQCVRCFRIKPPSCVVQPMSDLPATRVTEARPFAISGVDYCGPFYVKNSQRKSVPTKAFVAVFVCFVTRAIHLELVSDLSTSAFLAALRRFVARRGLVTEMNSDNGTNFKGAFNQLRKLHELFQSASFQKSVNEWSSQQGIKWKFIPPRAPHFGGLWEAAVRSMKFHLRRVVGDTPMTYEDLLTVLVEIEGCLNSRPLTPLSDDPADMEVLTPGHFLTGSNMQQIADVDVSDIPDNRLNHWRAVQKRIQHFWVRWRREYLQQLQTRIKWHGPVVKITPGMMVLIREDNVPPRKWPLGRILETHPAEDGIIRVVTIKTANSDEVKRPVANICILPFDTQGAELN